jgi:predicted GNAT superfamily acetyltransferase
MLDGGISISAIKRDYNKLGQIQDLIVYMDSHSTHVIVIDSSAEVNNDRFEQVFRLQFKSSNLLKFKNNFDNIVQVDKVAVLRKAGTQGIASTVYKMIVDNGFTARL